MHNDGTYVYLNSDWYLGKFKNDKKQGDDYGQYV